MVLIESLSKEENYLNYFSLLEQLSNTKIYIDVNSKKNFDNFIDKFNNDFFIKIIKINSDIVGSVTILKEEKIHRNFLKVGHIEDVVVDKNHRGKGLGKKLIEIAKNECKDCYKIILDCSDEKVRFYEKCGFEKKNNQMCIYKN